ncbi:MAG: hypothetical protein KKC46_10560 [Proteobacteria bacterium]|nr:hypothetical protein [Pseudomonadota bacterium]
MWIAVDRYGKRFFNCVLGDRGTATGEQLWDTIKNIKNGKIVTDYWKPYENLIPQELHIQSKAETFAVEGYSSFFDTFLQEFEVNPNATAFLIPPHPGPLPRGERVKGKRLHRT